MGLFVLNGFVIMYFVCLYVMRVMFCGGVCVIGLVCVVVLIVCVVVGVLVLSKVLVNVDIVFIECLSGFVVGWCVCECDVCVLCCV